eukprot:3093069-Rhodomonas_salina.1
MITGRGDMITTIDRQEDEGEEARAGEEGARESGKGRATTEASTRGADMIGRKGGLTTRVEEGEEGEGREPPRKMKTERERVQPAEWRELQRAKPHTTRTPPAAKCRPKPSARRGTALCCLCDPPAAG